MKLSRMDTIDEELYTRYRYRGKQKLTRACKGLRESDEDQNSYVEANSVSIIQAFKDSKEYRKEEAINNDEFFQGDLREDENEYDSRISQKIKG